MSLLETTTPQQADGRAASLWSSVREALRGSHQDFTAGNAGDTWPPTVVNFFGFWVLELPLAWLLARPLAMHAEGAFLAIVIAECSMAVAGVVLFRQGRWKRRRI